MANKLKLQAPFNTVYILGAGASHGSRLISRLQYNQLKGDLSRLSIAKSTVPNSDEFFDPFSDVRKERARRNYLELIRYMIRFFGTRHDIERIPKRRGVDLAAYFDEFIARWKNDAQGPDIENVFTRLQAEIDRHPNESPELLRTRAQLLQLISAKLAEACEGKYSLDYLKLCEILKPNDTVLTFNWDDLIDKAFAVKFEGTKTFHNSLLAASPSPIHRSSMAGAQALYLRDFRNSSHIPEGPLFLKLHGSVTWFACPIRDCPRYNQTHQAIELVSIKQSHAGLLSVVPEPYYSNEMPDCSVCGADMSRVIIPPIISKPYEAYPAIKRSWAIAARVLADADRIVCLGYSFRPVDVYSEWLLASSVRRRLIKHKSKGTAEILVVDPSNSPTRRVKAITRDWAVVSKLTTTISDWIDKQ